MPKPRLFYSNATAWGCPAIWIREQEVTNTVKDGVAGKVVGLLAVCSKSIQYGVPEVHPRTSII